MSEDPSVLGFSGRRYPQVIRHAERRTLSTGREVLVPTPALLIACKLEAYQNRGISDPMWSKDLQDISALLDGCHALEASIRHAEADVREFIAEHIGSIVRNPAALEALLGQLPRGGDPTAQDARVRSLLDRLSA